MKIIFFLIIAVSFSSCIDREEEKIIDGNDRFQLLLKKEKVMVELAFQTEYHLVLKNPVTGISKKITGRYGTLPTVKRYLSVMKIEKMDSAQGSLFNIHYVHPEEFTPDEFDFIVSAYRKNRDSVPELKSKINTLVYGNQWHFHEVFMCPEKFFLITDLWGQISIVTDSSYEGLTTPIELRHSNVIGRFDDNQVLTLRKGKIVSGEKSGLLGKPVKKIAFMDEATKSAYAGDIEVLWSDILYNDRETGINEAFVLASKNSRGQRLDEVFIYKK